MTDNDAKMAIEELETVVVSIGVIIAAVISSVIQRSSGAGSQVRIPSVCWVRPALG